MAPPDLFLQQHRYSNLQKGFMHQPLSLEIKMCTFLIDYPAKVLGNEQQRHGKVKTTMCVIKKNNCISIVNEQNVTNPVLEE